MRNKSVFDEKNIEYLVHKTKAAKIECLKMCMKPGLGHISSALSCAEIVGALYYEFLSINPQEPLWDKRDRFVMSKNHASILLYPILKDLGFLTEKEIDNYLSNGSYLGMHSKLKVPGIDFAGGSLGIGMGVAAGIAYSAKCSNEVYKTIALIGDGELYEGCVWEAAIFAAHNKLQNLIVILDRNKMCLTDYTEKILKLDPIEDKWRSFGWEVDVINGHDMKAIVASLKKAWKNNSNRPYIIIADTEKGHGVDFIEGALYWHGITPKGEKAVSALKQLRGIIK